MLNKTEQSITAGPGSNNNLAGRDNNITNIFFAGPRDLIDDYIKKKISRLVKCRFYAEYELKTEALQLSRSVFEGDLAGGSNAARSLALAWCSRILAHSHDLEQVEKYVKPAVEKDGGFIAFHSFENGLVKLKMQGSCSGCPSSQITLKSGIEGLLKRMVPEVMEVEAEAG